MRRSFPFVSEDARRFPPLSSTLGPYSQKRALDLFRAGRDTFDIAWLLACREPAVWNAIRAAKVDV